jgi:hypothetical protein
MTTSISVSRSSQRHWVIEIRHARGLRALRGLSLFFGLLVFGSCDAAQSGASDSPTAATNVAATVQPEESRMWMTVGERRFAITLADTQAASAFAAMLPLSMDLADLQNNEKYADLPQSLPTNASRPGTIRNGDLMLYGSRTLVIFYLTFKSSYSYTRLGHVDDPDGLAQTLGREGVRIEFSRN